MKIAVVEDCLPVRRLLVRRAEHEAGVTVVAQAGAEEEAVSAVLATSPDLLLLDLRLSEGSGLNVLQRLRQRQFLGKIFVLSSEDADVYRPLCVQRGATGFYDKAYDLEQLLVDVKDMAQTMARGLVGPAAVQGFAT